MICSSSWDSANMESSSTPTTWEWSPADIATGTTILILVLDEAATVKGPYDDIRRPARYTASQGPQCQTASTGDHKPIFTPLGRSPGQNGSYSHSGAVVRSPEPFFALPPPPAPAVISSLSLAVHDLIEHRRDMRAPRLASCRWPKVQQCQSVRTTRPRPTRRRVADGDGLECLSVNDGRVARSGCGRRARIPVGTLRGTPVARRSMSHCR